MLRGTRNAGNSDLRRLRPRRSNGLFEFKRVEPPADPDPSQLSGAAKSLWDGYYRAARNYFKESAYEDAEKAARKTAWKGLRHASSAGRVRSSFKSAFPSPPKTIKIKGDERLAELAPILGMTFFNNKGHLVEYGMAESPVLPRMGWDDATKTAYIFLKDDDASSCETIDSDMQDAANMFRRFTKHEPKCQRTIKLPASRLNLYYQGQMDTVVYRSDKWNARNPSVNMEGSQEYLHELWDGASIYTNQKSPSDPITIIALHGGKLDVEERGMIF